ncbi:hypothetical protein [Rhizobium leguminosarum]|jgi:hypothetical protein|uniref:hypothetical protein n=1 Tax=Rhizobium leguminosarum TaxID=384 RepID=UPI0016126E56|nr:hypothetical protein [Rhizobium leguminosarum]MBB4505973.1 hypothetical protein [Rhizobium leguminosarum]
MKMENPAALMGSANRVPNIKSLGRADIQNPIEIQSEIQSDLLAVRSVMRRFRVSFWHAKTICRLSGLGGQQA